MRIYDDGSIKIGRKQDFINDSSSILDTPSNDLGLGDVDKSKALVDIENLDISYKDKKVCIYIYKVYVQFS